VNNLESVCYATQGKVNLSKNKKNRKMKKVYRWAIVHFIGIMGAVATATGVWSAYLSQNNDWFILAIFGALVTWFYLEVVAPNNK